MGRRTFLALLLGVGACAGRPAPSQPPPPPAPHLRVEPRVGLSGQLATASITGLAALRHPEWRWARLTVESPDGTAPIDSLWAVPHWGTVSRRWWLSGEGPTIVTLSLYTEDLTWPHWQTEFLLDTHANLPLSYPLQGVCP